MFEIVTCIFSVCISRADVFCTTFISGILLFSLGLVLSWENLIRVKFFQFLKQKTIKS